MSSTSGSVDEVIDDITRLHRSLPPRPHIDEVEAAVALLRAVDKEEKIHIDAILKQQQHQRRSLVGLGGVPEELLVVRELLQKTLGQFRSREQKREALKLLELEKTHADFDDLVQRAERCMSPPAAAAALVERRTSSEFGSREGGSGSSSSSSSYLDKGKMISTPKPCRAAGEEIIGQLSVIKFASLIESNSKKGTKDLNLSNKLMDQVDWLPASIGKLSALITLNLSENQIAALPTSVGSLPHLTKLDLHSNRIAELPNSIGDLTNLVFLDLRGNQITTIPPTFAQLSHLAELDLSSNNLSFLPDAVGELTSLKKLNIEANNVEEIPHSIGHCVSLVELRADYNRLKGLPEAIGRMESLEVLSVRYNNIKSLPTTMASLPKLKELDVSFNELESVPESLCLATTLVKLNVGNNFADLTSLPRSIGNLEMLEELDISNNQIKVLPDTFGMLTHLRVLRLEENPLVVPPKAITQMEAQAVVEYMAAFVAKRAIKFKPLTKKSYTQFCLFAKPNKRKHDNFNYRRS